VLIKGRVEMKIIDIYAGKPDAGDEIRERGYEEFANSYIEPSGVNISRLASAEYGTPIFITGDKGTGKTALLHFLQNHVRTIDESACSSFVFFDSGYNHVVREKFDEISRSISTSIAIDSSIASVGQNVECDFTYIWKWQLYQRMINDDELFSGGLFIKDDNWSGFVNEINKICKSIEKGKMHIPATISLTATANPQLGTFTSGLKFEPIDLSQRSFNTSKVYVEFVKIINAADKFALQLKRSDIPYYIFIDELEAYRGENDTFYRDLRMIRDLLFTVKCMNDIFRTGTKLICSVRPEILNAINRFIQPNQLHKIMQGYDEKLIWEHTNTNSFSHPIIGVLLKRIKNAEERLSSVPISQETVIKKWFQPTVYGMHVCSYILENTWHKPRDIVRLLLSAQSKGSKNYSIFNQSTFDTFMTDYSKQCLVEIKEEMHALYKPDEIECIFGCLQGFRMVFSFNEISERANRLYPNSIFATQTFTVLNDMYRIGVIGNTINKNQSPRWEYKEQYNLYIDEPWKMIIHPALRLELGVNGRIDRCISGVTKRRKDRQGLKQIYTATITEISDRYVLTSFDKDGNNESGYIYMGNLGIDEFESGRLTEFLCVGQVLNVELIGYANYISRWLMRKVAE